MQYFFWSPLCSSVRARSFLACPVAPSRAQSHPVSSCSARRFFFSVRSLPLYRVASDSFFLYPPHSRASVSGRHAELFFFSDRSQPHSNVSARSLFLLCPVASAQFCLPARQKLFFRSQQSRRVRAFGHSHAPVQCAQLFSVSGRCLPRSNFFCDRSLLQKLCRPRSKENIFLSLPRRSVRAAGCAEIIFCHSRASVSCQGAMKIFVFIHSHAQMQGAQNFSFAQLFLLPSGLI
jgi:hypothetical protein